MSPTGLLDRLRAAGLDRYGSLGLAVSPQVGAAFVIGGPADDGNGIATGGTGTGGTAAFVVAADVAEAVRQVEAALRPRWVWWSAEPARLLLDQGVRLATCWDIAAAHRLLFGGWRADPALVWAALHELDVAAIPAMGQLDLLAVTGDAGGDPEQPAQLDGHLRAEWAAGGWARSPARLIRWAATGLDVADRQAQRLAALDVRGDPGATARAESAAELMCADLAAAGLPVDRGAAEGIIAAYVGPRPRDEREAEVQRRDRDHEVLRLVSGAGDLDLRNPAQVRSLLTRVGIDVPDTRSWRLEPFRAAHPAVEALLRWRKAERISTTYGYQWLAERVGADGRLRGAWHASDGAAGRMTAQAGLHNLPADLRPAVVAEPGYSFVRADLGQVEPRVLAVVSADPALMAAATDADLYAPVAARLQVERPVAKVAVLAAMYGQTSGTAGQALRGLEAAYPVAMDYLRMAYDDGRAGRDVRTYGGRLVRMPAMPRDLDEAGERAWLSGRGRYARNAVVQGAAAELFKAWAVTVRTRSAGLDARIVLCLHDELLVHVRTEQAPAVVRLLGDCLQETAARWMRGAAVRFVAETSVVRRWSDAK